MVKQKRKEKAGKWDVPLPKVRAQAEAEVFKMVTSGKRGKKAWKRMVSYPFTDDPRPRLRGLNLF